MNGHVPDCARVSFSFGNFVLDRAGKQLREAGRPVQLGYRAFDLLVKLVEHAGDVVSHADLVAYVWPSTVVEDTSLRAHVSALRKALGDGRRGQPRYIANVPGRGYSFVMPVRPARRDSATLPPCGGAPVLPPRPARAIGRTGVIDLISARLACHRLVSIIGPGGMGKTTVALAVAESQACNYRDGVRFVDLAALSDATLVPVTLALAVGAPQPQAGAMPALGAFLGGKHMLIVVDNCEHVIHAVAALVEALLTAAPAIQVLATSRESLDVNGEWVHRLAALASPEPHHLLSAAQALAFPAVQLFVERARANADQFVLDQANLEPVLHLCRRLDGIPLAIELAAARIDSLGVQGLVARLDSIFQLLTRGRRSALPRHRTLQALFDWSHALLDETERQVLGRLSLFRARFTMEGAVAVCACANVAASEVVDSVVSLVAKSLVAWDASAGPAGYRLLYTTRTYASERLLHSGGLAWAAGRHTQYCLTLFTRARADLDTLGVPEWIASYGFLMDDVRAALDFSFSPVGDAVVGVELAIAAYHPAYGMGQLEGCLERIELVLDKIALLEPPQPELELRARTAWCYLSSQTRVSGTAQAQAIDSTVALAERVGSARQIVSALYGASIGHFGHGNYPAALALASRIRHHTGEGDPVSVLLSDRLVAMTLHFLGEHQRSRQLAHQVLAHPTVPMYRDYVSQVPKSVSMRIVLARILWIEGKTDQAMRLGQESLAMSEGCPPFVICQVLAVAAIPLALWRGDLDQASALNARLLELATSGSLDYWISWAGGFAGVIAGVGDTSQAPANPKEADMYATLDPRLVTDEALARSEQGMAGWCAPEVFRARGERLLRGGDRQAVRCAEQMFVRAIATARAQQALSWELRAATSLARLWLAEGRSGDARALLGKVAGRFSEGHATADLRAADALLAQLAQESGHA